MPRKFCKLWLVLVLILGLCLLPSKALAAGGGGCPGGSQRSTCTPAYPSVIRLLLSRPGCYFYLTPSAGEQSCRPSCPPAAAPETQPEAQPQVKPSQPEAQPEVKPSQPEAQPEDKPSQPESQPEAQPEVKPSQPEAQPEVKPSQPEAKPEDKPSQPESQPEAKPEVRPSQPTVSPDDPDDALAAEVIDLVNRERQAEGLEPLQADPLLIQAAGIRAQEILISFSHTRPDGSSCFSALQEVGCRYQRAGENLALGQPTAAKAVSDWMSSPGHRANILDPRFKHIGVAVQPATNGGYAWTQFFSD